MVCSKCGAQLDPSSAFCINCGTAVQNTCNTPPPPPQPVNAVPYNGAQNVYGNNDIQMNFFNTKEYISSVSTCRVLGIIALIGVLLTQPFDIAGIICAIVALSKIKKLPEVHTELLDPRSLYNYQKAEREAETARKLSKAAIIIEIVWVSLSVLAVIASLLLGTLPFLPFITDFIETVFM